jgi:hypothetical protein
MPISPFSNPDSYVLYSSTGIRTCANIMHGP